MNDINLKDRIIFAPDHNTFYQIVCVLPMMPEADPLQTLKAVDLATGKTCSDLILQDIGKEYFLIPSDYPQRKIDIFLKAAKSHREAEKIILDITQEITLITDT